MPRIKAPLNPDFGNWIRLMREARDSSQKGWGKLSRAEAATAMGISQIYLTTQELGTKPPTRNFCEIISQYYDVPLKECLEKAGIKDVTTEESNDV
jgi:transcriptional regulator with XRE-family HTH domain